MFITDKKELESFDTPYRLWQGIPGIEVTKKGRVFVTFYSGGVKEDVGNFVLLLKSDDGINFTKPIAVAYKEENRCYDPCLWIDTLGRLWLFWACSPDFGVYAAVCENPDADELCWSDVKYVGGEVMMNKPTVLTSGEWMLPVAVWKKGIQCSAESSDNDRRAFAYKSIDNGESFVKIGGADISKRSYDEHMIVELGDGTLAMYVRTIYGIGVSYSYDSGKTWTTGEDSCLGGPCSRFFIRRLKSGRLLLVNHVDFKGRNNLTALLSEDDGKSWKYKLLLDGRNNVSYPDGVEANDGYIYITYDRERGSFKKSLSEAYSDAREILYAKITEQDIINGALTDKDSFLGRVVSKLDKYAFERDNPFNEDELYSDSQLAKKLVDKDGDEIVSYLFDRYKVNCDNMHKIDYDTLDKLIDKLKRKNTDVEKTVYEIIKLIRSVAYSEDKSFPVVDRIKSLVNCDLTREITLQELSKELGISMYYMCHLFKKATGVTIVDYRNGLKLKKAKYYLVNSDKKITDIALECGFSSSSYFSKMFTSVENVTPAQYRKMLKRT